MVLKLHKVNPPVKRNTCQSSVELGALLVVLGLLLEISVCFEILVMRTSAMVSRFTIDLESGSLFNICGKGHCTHLAPLPGRASFLGHFIPPSTTTAREGPCHSAASVLGSWTILTCLEFLTVADLQKWGYLVPCNDAASETVSLIAVFFPVLGGI